MAFLSLSLPQLSPPRNTLQLSNEAREINMRQSQLIPITIKVVGVVPLQENAFINKYWVRTLKLGSFKHNNSHFGSF